MSPADPVAEHRLLLEAVLAPAPLLEERYLRWWATFDPDAPVDPGTYRLLPLLWTRARDLPAAASFEGRLRGIYRRAWVENHQVLAGARPGLAALAEAGVPTVLLKGSALVGHEYAELGARPLRDVDVLVPHSERHRARAALAAAGWHQARPVGPVKIEALGRVALRRERDGCELDVHWRAPGDLAPDLAGGWLWRDPVPTELLGVPCLRLGATQHLAVTLAHGLRGNVESPVRWVADAARIVEHADGLDWDGLVAVAEQARLCRRIGVGLSVLEGLNTLAVPEGVGEALSRHTAVERWEYRARSAPPGDRAALARYRLATYWSGRREQPWPVAARGMALHSAHTTVRWARRRTRSVRARLR